MKVKELIKQLLDQDLEREVLIVIYNKDTITARGHEVKVYGSVLDMVVISTKNEKDES